MTQGQLGKTLFPVGNDERRGEAPRKGFGLAIAEKKKARRYVSQATAITRGLSLKGQAAGYPCEAWVEEDGYA